MYFEMITIKFYLNEIFIHLNNNFVNNICAIISKMLFLEIYHEM